MKRTEIILAVIVLAIAGILFSTRFLRHHEGNRVAGLRGKPAPAFTLKTLDGKTVSLADYQGKAILVNFWATWCSPCKIEMPWLVDLQQQYGPQGFQVLGIAMDDASPEEIGKFSRKMGVNYPVLLGTEAVGNAYGGLPYLPTSIYVGRDGKVVSYVYGIKSHSDFESDIKNILAGAPVSANAQPATTTQTAQTAQ